MTAPRAVPQPCTRAALASSSHLAPRLFFSCAAELSLAELAAPGATRARGPDIAASSAGPGVTATGSAHILSLVAIFSPLLQVQLLLLLRLFLRLSPLFSPGPSAFLAGRLLLLLIRLIRVARIIILYTVWLTGKSRLIIVQPKLIQNMNLILFMYKKYIKANSKFDFQLILLLDTSSLNAQEQSPDF